MAYTLDILMTNISCKPQLQRPVHHLTCVKWHGILLHQYASSCCRIHQRSSPLTQLSSPTRELVTHLQRPWWSHVVAHFLPRHGVRLVSSCPESSVPGGKGDFYKNDSLHNLCCSGIWIGEHDHSHHQSIGRTIQRPVRDTVIATDVLVDSQTIGAKVLLPNTPSLSAPGRSLSAGRCEVMRGKQAARYLT